MEKYPELRFPAVKFRIRTENGVTRVWDGVRKCWLVLTPEEWVRRHLIHYFTDIAGIPAQMISQECPVRVNGQLQRADLVLFDNYGKQLLLAECKAPEVKIDASVFAQAVRYNNQVGARYILITNGLQHFIYERDESGRYNPLKQFPDFRKLYPEVKGQ